MNEGVVRPHSARFYTLRRIALITGAISALLSAYLMWSVYHPFGKTGVNEVKSMVIAAGPYRSNLLFKVTSATTTPILVTIDGKPRSVLDMVILKDGSVLYSVFDTFTPLTSNVYKMGKDGVLTPLTNSSGFKDNFSVDPSETHLVYEETKSNKREDIGNGASPTIVQLSLNNGTVQEITTGTNPHFLQSGAIVVAQKEGTFVYPPSVGSKGNLILPSNTYSLYAVREDGSQVASYNYKTKSIDLFKVTATGTLSYDYSTKVENQPMNLIYSEGSPVATEVSESPKGTVYILTSYGRTISTTRFISTPAPMLERLIYVTK